MAKPLKWKKNESADAYMQRSFASMQKRKVNRALGRGGAIRIDKIEGLDEFRRGLHDFSRQLDEVLNEILRGPWGEELLDQVRAELSDHRDTGETMKHLGIWQAQGGAVYVGHEQSAQWKKHPFHSRANFASIMTWLESGTKRHMIPSKVIPGRVVKVQGRYYSQVEHLGTKPQRVMKSSLRVFAAEGERLVLDKLRERLELQMRRAGAIEGGVAV